MKNLEKSLPVLLAVVAFALFWWYLEVFQKYAFFTREQQQIFLFDWQAIKASCIGIGGLSLFIAQFLIQFFKLPLIGSAVTSALGVLAGFSLWKASERHRLPVWLFPLFMIPSVLQFWALSDILWGYDGFVAFVIDCLALWLYQSCISDKGPWARITLGALLSAILYMLIGPAALLFAIFIIMMDFMNGSRLAVLQAVSVVVIFICAFIALRSAQLGTFSKGVLPSFYYDDTIKMPSRFNILYFSAILPSLLAFALRKCTFGGKAIPNILSGCAATIAVVVLSGIAWRQQDRMVNVDQRLQHDVVVGNWDDILRCRTATSGSNYLYMNYVNLALSQKGLLLENMFRYSQSPFSLLLDFTSNEFVQEVALITANCYYWLGDIGVAQSKAFDSFIGARYRNPSMLQMMVKTNLIFGEYEVAGKYISELEKTWGYRSWAKGMRRFLYNDDAVMADPELGERRKCLPDSSDEFTLQGEPFLDLLKIMECNPRFPGARDYAIAFLLLYKDNKLTDDFLARFPLKTIFEKVPTLAQQLVIATHENDDAACLALGADQEMIDMYNDFKKTYYNAVASGQNPKTALRSRFAYSYWYFVLFHE